MRSVAAFVLLLASAAAAADSMPPPDSSPLQVGGQLRWKPSYIDYPLFGFRGGDSDGYVLQRLLVHGQLHAGKWANLIIELADARAFGKSSPVAPIDADRADLQLAYVDARLPSNKGELLLRLGRQELSFDPTQRFVSLREGPNVRQAFEGLRLIWSLGQFDLSLFDAVPVGNRNERAFDDRRDTNVNFGGAYATWKSVDRQTTTGIYSYRYSRDEAIFQGVRADEVRWVFGLRHAGATGPWDWDIEPVYQAGTFGANDIAAWALGSQLGYRFHDASWTPRVGAQFDIATGDRHRTDDHEQTFNPLFPKGGYFSEAGLTGFSNLINVAVSLSGISQDKTRAQFAVGKAWRQTTGDVAYAQPLIPLVATAQSKQKAIGHYFQLQASHPFGKRFGLGMEWLHYFLDAQLKAAGGHDVDYVNTSLSIQF